MGTVLHCLGAVHNVDSTNRRFLHEQRRATIGRGNKNGVCIFRRIMGGQMTDGIHYDFAKIRLFNLMNQPESWFVGDRVARDYYKCDQILKVTVVELKKNPTLWDPQIQSDNWIYVVDGIDLYGNRITDLLQNNNSNNSSSSSSSRQQQQHQTGFNTQGYFGQLPGSRSYPPQPQPHQGGYVSYGAAPGTTYEQPLAFPPPPGNVATGYAPIPPPLSMFVFDYC